MLRNYCAGATIAINKTKELVINNIRQVITVVPVMIQSFEIVDIQTLPAPRVGCLIQHLQGRNMRQGLTQKRPITAVPSDPYCETIG